MALPASPPLQALLVARGGSWSSAKGRTEFVVTDMGPLPHLARSTAGVDEAPRGLGAEAACQDPPSVLLTAQSPRLPHQGPWTGRERIRASAVLAQDTGQNACRSRLRGPLTLFVHLSLFWKHRSFPYRAGGEEHLNAEHPLSNDVLGGSVGCNEAV